MVETFPHHSFLAKCLRGLSGFDNWAEDVEIGYLFQSRLIVFGRYPKSCNTNIFSREGPLVDIVESVKRDR